MCIRWLEIAALVALGFGWSPQAASSVSYTYTGNSFTAADPPYTTSDKVDGWFSVPLQLAGNLPLTEIGSSLADFSFNDNQQVRTPGNTSVCAFKVATDAAGAIIEWSITLHQSPTPASGNPMQVVDSSGTPGDQGGDCYFHRQHLHQRFFDHCGINGYTGQLGGGITTITNRLPLRRGTLHVCGLAVHAGR